MSTQLQNFYKATLTRNWSATTGDFNVSVAPTVSSGYLVVSPNNSTLREIIYYTATGSNAYGPFITVSTIGGRGIGGTSAQVHSIGESVRMNLTAEHWQEMQDDIDSIVAAGLPAGSEGDIIYNDGANWVAGNPLPSCKTLIPQCPIPTEGGQRPATVAAFSTNTTAYVGQVIVPFGITVNKLSIVTGTVTTPGVLDIVIFNETGQTQEISVTTESLASSDTLYTTAVSGVYLPAGIHYILVVPNGTMNIQTYVWRNEPSAPFAATAGLQEDVTSESKIQGTLTVTAGTPPTTFDPAAITPTTQLTTLVCRLDN